MLTSQLINTATKYQAISSLWLFPISLHVEKYSVPPITLLLINKRTNYQLPLYILSATDQEISTPMC